MKITKSQLKQIIKEELEAVTEVRRGSPDLTKGMDVDKFFLKKGEPTGLDPEAEEHKIKDYIKLRPASELFKEEELEEVTGVPVAPLGTGQGATEGKMLSKFEKVQDAMLALGKKEMQGSLSAEEKKQLMALMKQHELILRKMFQGTVGSEVKTGAVFEEEKPMTAKQKKFAALAEPKDEITYADKIAGATKKDKKEAK